MEDNKQYDKFIRNGLAIGFTDDQIDFLWEWNTYMAKIIRTTERKVEPEDEEMLKRHYALYDKNKKKDPFYKVALKHLEAWLKH